jgi:class 3 adenylate cyclase
VTEPARSASPLPAGDPPFDQIVQLRSPIGRAWELVCATDAINRAAGMAPIHYDVQPLPDGTSRRIVRTKMAGLDAVGEELVSAWQYPRHFEIRRTFESGPLRAIVHRSELEPLDAADPEAGTQVRIRMWLAPRGLAGRVVRLGFGRIIFPKMVAFLRARDRQIVDDSIPTTDAARTGPAWTPSLPERELVQRLVERAGALVDGPALPSLVRLVLAGDEDELQRLRPLALARGWGLGARETIDAFLAATTAGLLRLRWGVVCPHCRGTSEEHERLDQVGADGFCPACNHGFEVDLDRRLEAVFDPHPQVRTLDVTPRCLAGPGAVPHVRYQRLLEPGETFAPQIELARGRYQLRVTGCGDRRWLRVEPGADEPAEPGFAFDDDGLRGDDLDLPAGRALPLPIVNRSSRRAVVVIEDAAWGDDALTAAELVADQRFADLFSGAMLAEGVSLGVQSVTILFTDLVGSTALYRELGDARAFGLVWSHFDVLTDVVRSCGGVVVKTIGDAIMAAFVRPTDALAAARELHARLPAGLEGRGWHERLALKVGLHEGPSIAVTLNEQLDWFGTTVNTAARVQGLSEGGDVVVTQSLAEATAGCASLVEAGWSVEPLHAQLKGLEAPLRLLRLRPPA